MQSSTLAAPIKSKQLARYDETTFVLTFNIAGIDSEYANELERILNSEPKYNGYISLNSHNFGIYQAVYEATDMYGFDNEYRDEIEDLINASIAKLAEQNGGLEKILFR